MPKFMNAARYKLPNPAARLESLGKADATPAADWTFNVRRRAEQIAAARRPLPLPDKPLQSYDKTPLDCKVDKMFLPSGEFYMTKSGELREKKIVVSILRAAAGKTTFNVVSRTDPAKVIAMTREIERICGKFPAAVFATAAADVIGKAKDKPEPHRITPDIRQISSGADCKRGAHTASRWQTAGGFLGYVKK